MKNMKKAENQPGSKNKSTGTAPSNLLNFADLRPQDLSPGGEMSTVQSQRKLRSGRNQKINNKLQKKNELATGVQVNTQKQSSLDVLDLRSPQASTTVSNLNFFANDISTAVNAKVCNDETTFNNFNSKKQLPQCETVETDRPMWPIQILRPSLETEKQLTGLKLGELTQCGTVETDRPIWPIQILRPPLDEQLTKEPEELSRTDLVRTVATVDPVLHSLDEVVDRDHTIDATFAVGNVFEKILLQASQISHAPLNNPTNSPSNTNQSATSQQFIQQTPHDKMEPTVLSQDRGRNNNGQAENSVVSTNWSTTHKALQELYNKETEIKMQENLLNNKNNSNKKNNNNKQNNIKINLNNAMKRSMDPVALLPGYQTSGANNAFRSAITNTSNNNNNINNLPFSIKDDDAMHSSDGEYVYDPQDKVQTMTSGTTPLRAVTETARVIRDLRCINETQLLHFKQATAAAADATKAAAMIHHPEKYTTNNVEDSFYSLKEVPLRSLGAVEFTEDEQKNMYGPYKGLVPGYMQNRTASLDHQATIPTSQMTTYNRDTTRIQNYTTVNNNSQNSLTTTRSGGSVALRTAVITMVVPPQVLEDVLTVQLINQERDSYLYTLQLTMAGRMKYPTTPVNASNLVIQVLPTHSFQQLAMTFHEMFMALQEKMLRDPGFSTDCFSPAARNEVYIRYHLIRLGVVQRTFDFCANELNEMQQQLLTRYATVDVGYVWRYMELDAINIESSSLDTFMSMRNIQQEYEENTATVMGLSKSLNAHVLAEVEIRYPYHQSMVVHVVFPRRDLVNEQLSPHEHEAARQIRAVLPGTDVRQQQSDETVVHWCLHARRGRVSELVLFAQRGWFTTRQVEEYKHHGHLTNEMKQIMVDRCAESTMSEIIEPLTHLRTMQRLFRVYTIGRDAYAWKDMVEEIVERTRVSEERKNRVKEAEGNKSSVDMKKARDRPRPTNRRKKHHKSESSSDGGSKRTDVSTSTVSRHNAQSLMLKTLLESVSGIDKKQSQTLLMQQDLTTALAKQKTDMVAMMQTTSEVMRVDITTMATKLEQHEQVTQQRFAAMDERFLTLNRVNLKVVADDRSNYHACHADAWITDAEVANWKELYLAAVRRLNVDQIVELPPTTAETEAGLHHALQRMQEGDCFPCEPVYSTERAFFRHHTTIAESPLIQDGIAGLIGIRNVRKGVYFHYHGRVHYPSYGEVTGPYTLGILGGHVQLDGAKERNGVPGPVMLNEYIWSSEGNNIEFSEDIHRRDIGRMRTSEHIYAGNEWFLEYDRSTQNYEWHEAYVHRCTGMIKQMDSIYVQLPWDTQLEQEEMSWAAWIVTRMDATKLAEILLGPSQHTMATANAMMLRLESMTMMPPNLSTTVKSHLPMVLRILVESYQVVNGSHSRLSNFGNIDVPFHECPLHSVFYRMREFQLEHDFKTRKDPRRMNRREDSYFVQIVVKMKRIGIYIANYETDRRITDETNASNNQQVYNTRSSRSFTQPASPSTKTIIIQSPQSNRLSPQSNRSNVANERYALEQELDELLAADHVDDTNLHKIRMLLNRFDQSNPTETNRTILKKPNHFKPRPILDWTINNKPSGSETDSMTTTSNGESRSEVNSRGEPRRLNSQSLLFDTTMPLDKPNESIFTEGPKFKPNPYIDHNDEYFYSQFNDQQPRIKPELKPIVSNQRTFLNNKKVNFPDYIELDGEEEIPPRTRSCSTPATPPRSTTMYRWKTLDSNDLISDTQLCDADYFRGITFPYQERVVTGRPTASTKIPVRYYTTEGALPIEQVVNELRAWCYSNNKTTKEWGEALHSGIIFDSKDEQKIKSTFLILRAASSKFTDPDSHNNSTYTQICEWIEGMLYEILKRWRKPITADSAQDWLGTTQFDRGEFRYLKDLSEQIKIYAGYLPTAKDGVAQFPQVFKYIQGALKRTDKNFHTQLCSTFTMKLEMNQIKTRRTDKVSEDEHNMELLNKTIDHFTMTAGNVDLSSTIGTLPIKTSAISNIASPLLSHESHPRREHRRSYRPATVNINSYHPTINRQLEVINLAEDEDEDKGYSSSDLPTTDRDYFDWEDAMDEIAGRCVNSNDHAVLIQRQVKVTTKMGTGVFKKFYDGKPRLCIACGDVRHNVEQCYSATHDGFLSLPALAFLDEKSCERKIIDAQAEHCSLHNQPKEVILTIQNIVTRLRDGLTAFDREVNARNRRDALARRAKERMTGQRGLPPSFPSRPSVPISVPGATGTLRLTEESASLKAMRQQEIAAMREERLHPVVTINAIKHTTDRIGLDQIEERMNVIQAELSSKADKVVLHEGQGFLAYHNLIRSVNGIDTSNINDKLLLGHPINNNSLTFLNLIVRGVCATDEAMLAAEEYHKWAHDTSLSAMEPKGATGVSIQMDNGGARTVASRAFATHVKAPVIKLNRAASLTAFNKTTTLVDEYAVFVVVVTGFTTYGTRQTREFRVTALIAESDQPFILGAEAIAQQNIIFDPHSQQATFFANQDHQLTVPYVPWSLVQAEMANNATLQRAININVSNMGGNNNGKWKSMIDIMTDAHSNDSIEALLIDDFKSVTPPIKPLLLDAKTKAGNHPFETVRNLFNAIQTDPVPVVKQIKVPYARWMIFALLILGILYNQTTISNYSQRLVGIVYNVKERRMRAITPVMKALTKLEAHNNIEFLKLLMQRSDDTPRDTITVNVLPDVAELAKKIQLRQALELEESKQAIAALKVKYMRNDEAIIIQKPKEFPPHLWEYVFATQRVNAIKRFDILRSYPATDTLTEQEFRNVNDPPVDPSTLPQNRLEEILKRLLLIDISTETPARSLEKDVILAQCLANVDRYAHPDPNNPAKAKASIFHINLKNPLDPPCFRRSKRLAPPAYWSLRCRIDYMILRKEIELSTSSWNSPPMMVPQPDKIQQFLTKHGDNAPIAMTLKENAPDVRVLYRFTSDLRCVNERTFLEIHPLPLIPTLLDTTRGSDRYSTADIEDAFFTCLIDAESSQYTAFSAVDNHYQYSVMPMGAKNSANHFANIVQKAFGDMKDNAESSEEKMFFYQDDVLNYSKTLEYQLITQQKIYDVLRAYDLLFKIIKTHFNYKTQRVLGHVLTANGRLPDPSLTKTIRELAVPTTLQGIQSLLGLAQVAREYIPALATLIAPLQALSKKGIDVEAAWQDEQQEAFELLKKILTTPPSLLIPDLHKPFRVHVDACRVGKGIGAVLLQLNDKDKYQPVAYWSRGLIPAERNYSATELECTALHDTILHWQVYLLNGRIFDIIVDHYALVYMVTKAGGAEAQQRLLRLCLDLQQFTFNVIHRSGKDHLDADAVSRLLGRDDQPYVRTANELRDDTQPLTETELEYIQETYGQDCEIVRQAIEDGRANLAIQRQQIARIKINSSRIISCDTSDTDMQQVQKIIVNQQAAKHAEMVERLTTQRVKLSMCLAAHPCVRSSVEVPATNGSRTLDTTKQLGADKQWIYDQQSNWASKFPTKLRLKLLAQLSSNTLRLFAQDPIIFQNIKRRVEAELHKRSLNNSSNVKSTSTTLLTELLKDEPHIEHLDAVSELFRRQRSKQHRSLTECSDVTLTAHIDRIQQHYLATANQHYTTIVQHSLHVLSQPISPQDIDANAQVLTDTAMQKASAIHTERQQALAERKRRELELEDNQRRNEELQLQFRRDAKKMKKLQRVEAAKENVPRRKNKRVKTLEEEEMVEESICTTLEQYDWLVHQLYNDLESAEQYEIINVYSDRISGAFMSTARPTLHTDLLEPEGEENYQRKPINGTNGTLELVNLASRGQRTRDDVPWPTSEDQWLQHQQTDEYCRPFIDILVTSELKQLSDVDVESSDYFFRPQVDGKIGALCRHTRIVQKDSHNFTNITINNEIIQKVIPQILKQTCLTFLHDQLGHPGKQRTIDTIRLNYYWPNMHTDIQRYVQDCNFCKTRKAHNFRAKVPVQEYFRMSRPMDRMHADLAGPFPITERANKYVLLIKDALTKFLIVVPLPDKTADVVLKRFVSNVFAHYGTPRLLITDRGTDFVNAQMREWCRITQVKKVHTTPANPRSDGLAENQVRTTKDMIASYINNYQNDWDNFLPVIQFDYNTTVNTATGYTPYYLMFGRQANRADQPDVELPNKKDLHDYVQSFNNVMTNVWADTSHQILRNSKVMLQKQHPKGSLQYKEYKVGEFFFARRVPRRFYKNPFNEKVYKLNAKLQHRWTGPFIVTKVISPVVYEADIHNNRKMVHAVNMRPY